MLYPPVADLLKNVQSRYLLVNLVASRARQIAVEAAEFEEELTEDEAIARLREFLPHVAVASPSSLSPSRHLFSHIEWQMSGWIVSLAGNPPALPEGYAWAGEADMEKHAIPGAFKAYKPLLYGKNS